MRVVVTGSAGFVGQRVCGLLRNDGHQVVECDKDENVLTFSPEPAADAVVHLAADKYATHGELSPFETTRFNIAATQAALRLAPLVVLASTCKAADPATCYGASKLICERMVLNHGGRVLRLVNVLGSSGSVAEIWAAVPEDQPLPVTNCFRMFMEPEQAAGLLVRALYQPSGRYAPAQVRSYAHMRDLAATLYPGRPTVEVPLRFGDRQRERLIAEGEAMVFHDDEFMRVVDQWQT